MDKQELKPCPFCGNPAELYIVPKEKNPKWFKGGKFWSVRCTNEWCIIGHHIDIVTCKELVLEEWNRRKRRNKRMFKEKDNG